MVGKYSLRWGFYRRTAWLYKGSGLAVNEAVNPMKDFNVEGVAGRYEGIDGGEFLRIARRLSWFGLCCRARDGLSDENKS
jgi:hypothetical protein